MSSKNNRHDQTRFNAFINIMFLVVGSLVVTASVIGPEGLDLIPDTVKDPPSPLIRAHKIRGSESPVVGC